MHLNTRTFKITAILLIVIPSILMLAACSKLTAEQVADKATKVMQSVKNYEITETTNLYEEGGPPGATNTNLNGTGSGTVDRTNNAFAMDTNINSGDAAAADKQIIKTYMVNNTIYQNVSGGGAQPGWANQTATADDWKQISFADIKLIQDFLTGAQVKMLSDETIGGVSCYVLTVTGDLKKLYGLSSEPGMVNQDVSAISYWDNISKDFSSKIWIAKNGFNLAKIENKLSFGIKSQDLKLPDGSTDVKLTIQTSVLFNNFNKSGPIVLPAEAKATTVTTTQVAPTPVSGSSAPAMTIDVNKTYTATIKTNLGDIVVQLLAKNAPLTVNNFVVLARKGFYDGIIFHRVVKGFMIQSGDPTGTGSGGPGYKFADELPTTLDYMKGTVAMANAGPNTNGSQFFIMLGDYSGKLTKNYSIFGKVTSGQDVVDKIGEVPVAKGPSGEISSPTVDVHIVTVTITEQ